MSESNLKYSMKCIRILETGEPLHLRGIALTRDVFLDGEYLNPEKSQSVVNHSPDGFNWGYLGAGPTQLSLAILLELVDEETALKYVNQFKQVIVANLHGNFNVRINFKALLGFFEGNGQDYGDMLVHSYSFIEFEHKGHWFSKFLDFPNMPYETITVHKGTVEFDLLSNLTSEQFSVLKEYIHTKTMRKDLQEENKEVCMDFVMVQEPDKMFALTGGLGTGTFNGHSNEQFLTKI